ncbi:glycosyltransferase family 4 protein [Chitinivibrio alkaliphilus]|uniref:UDP-N-acetylglucosamine:undecaprenyl-P N-acetylglucosaminyl-1-P transferase n=1 Tax=Chitinivibrio alkaliphilus ACht1 TaxID=1313304 RepID=U7D8N6_9BACT|nr:MraY family glycosyltransferase [Chitinivibrio alkaliphilus]ERP31931.1 UDP-N-acetylglucosamine:undecaprenyl-P N-acetylglucosaminyl-1-P transferase [Chitinivibrio alkaliphilus ACht1]
MYEIKTALLLFLLFFSASASLVYLMYRSNLKHFFVDIPDKRKIHQLLIPRIGGFAFIISFFISLGVVAFFSRITDGNVLLYMRESAIFAPLVAGSAIIFFIGFLDDSTFINVGVGAKFSVQLLVALVSVYGYDMYIDTLYFLGSSLELGYLGPVISVLWIIGVTNSFNIIDGIDGLSASLSLLSICIASTILFFAGDPTILWVTIPVCAVIMGFLFHNYPPARIFAGDSGSLFFGFIAALYSIQVANMYHNGKGVETFAAFLVVGLPVLEVFVSMIRRFWYGLNENRGLKHSFKKVVSPDNLHMHHRLIFRGLTHEQALRFLVFLVFVFLQYPLFLYLAHLWE